jgi:hypothetical protein
MTPEEALKLKPGDQFVYVPSHAQGDLEHPDCEQGFVTSVRKHNVGAIVFGRYWSNLNRDRIRTCSTSEAASACFLVKKDTHDQEVVQEILESIERGEGACL